MIKSSNSFNAEDLKLKNPLNHREIIKKEIYDALKLKAISGKYMSELEKEAFCEWIFIKIHNDGVIEDYSCCEDYKFKLIYRTYHRNIAGGIKYFKLDKSKIKFICDRIAREIKAEQLLTASSHSHINIDVEFDKVNINEMLSEVPQNEVSRDLEYLYKVADNWEAQILIVNHKDELLREASKEARTDLKDLKNNH